MLWDGLPQYQRKSLIFFKKELSKFSKGFVNDVEAHRKWRVYSRCILFTSTSSLFTLQALIWIPLLVFVLWLVDLIHSGKSLRSIFTKHSNEEEVKPNSHDMTEEDEDVAAERKRVNDNIRTSLSPDEVFITKLYIYWVVM